MKICSFDIFDTLLLRPYIDPQEVWRVLEEREGAKGFASARKSADAMTYSDAIAHDTETSLEAAYRLMSSEFAPLMQREMDLEREVLTPNPEMKSRWERAKADGCRRIIVSDMYMPRPFIEQVLSKKGFGDWDALYLSSDRGVRKSSGKLFQLMLQEQQVAAADVLHIGDNPESDVNVPRRLGIQVEPYRKISEQFFAVCPFAWHIDARLAGELALGWHLFRCERGISIGQEPTYWNRLGFLMGGVLGYLYVSWMVRVAKEKGIGRLLFVARDGYILQKICNELYPEMQTGYIYAPRLTSIALLGAIGADPNAVKDRQSYLDAHFQNVDAERIGREYADYVSQFRVAEDTALVDGCSSAFSAQRLVEKAVGKDVFCFYLLSMAEHHHAAALFATDLCSLPFQLLSEFIFGAPEKPILGVSDGKPVYSEEISSAEDFKIRVSQEIADGAVSCAVQLHRLGIQMHPSAWLGYTDWFMRCLTADDRSNLASAKVAYDVQQNKFHSVVWKPRGAFRIRCNRCGFFSFKVSVDFPKGSWEMHFSRHGIHCQYCRMQVRYMQVNNVRGQL